MMYTFLMTGVISLACLDILLTHYQFFLTKKKNVFNINDEMNDFPRWLMKKFGITAKSFLIHCAIQASLIIGVASGLLFFGASIYFMEIILSAALGMVVVVNQLHNFNLIFFRRFWNSERYWEIKKEINELEQKYK